MTKKNTIQTKTARESNLFRTEGLSLGSRVRALRLERGWTLEHAGLRMNMDPKHLWKLERAYAGLNVTLVTLVRIAEAFDEPVQSLFAYRGEVRDPPAKKKRSIKRRASLPFDYSDAPLPDECFSNSLPILKVDQLLAQTLDHELLHVKLWARMKDTSLVKQGRFIIPLTDQLLLEYDRSSDDQGMHLLCARPNGSDSLVDRDVIYAYSPPEEEADLEWGLARLSMDRRGEQGELLLTPYNEERMVHHIGVDQFFDYHIMAVAVARI